MVVSLSVLPCVNQYLLNFLNSQNLVLENTQKNVHVIAKIKISVKISKITKFDSGNFLNN